jgi:hypothetical protein
VQLGRWLTGAVRETKTELSITTIAPEDGFRKILRALDHNDPVALLVDGNLYTHGATVEWFGRPTTFPAGPGVLAQRTGALVVAGCERTVMGRSRTSSSRRSGPAPYGSTAEHTRNHRRRGRSATCAGISTSGASSGDVGRGGAGPGFAG